MILIPKAIDELDGRYGALAMITPQLALKAVDWCSTSGQFSSVTAQTEAERRIDNPPSNH